MLLTVPVGQMLTLMATMTVMVSTCHLNIVLALQGVLRDDLKNQDMPQRKPDIGYIPTPQAVVKAMLTLAGVTSDDILYDLGSGDGRVAIAAAEQFGTRGVGIDIDPERIREANENARQKQVSDRVEFREQDLFESNFSEATVVILYLLPSLNLRLRPELFRQLEPGTRVVSHDFDMGDWKPDRVMHIQTPEESTLYYWVIPREIPEYLCAG